MCKCEPPHPAITWDGVSLTFCPGWPGIAILLISTFWVARITDVRHHTQLDNGSFNPIQGSFKYEFLLGYWMQHLLFKSLFFKEWNLLLILLKKQDVYSSLSLSLSIYLPIFFKIQGKIQQLGWGDHSTGLPLQMGMPSLLCCSPHLAHLLHFCLLGSSVGIWACLSVIGWITVLKDTQVQMPVNANIEGKMDFTDVTEWHVLRWGGCPGWPGGSWMSTSLHVRGTQKIVWGMKQDAWMLALKVEGWGYKPRNASKGC
jgi:hypothetical protein